MDIRSGSREPSGQVVFVLVSRYSESVVPVNLEIERRKGHPLSCWYSGDSERVVVWVSAHILVTSRQRLWDGYAYSSRSGGLIDQYPVQVRFSLCQTLRLGKLEARIWLGYWVVVAFCDPRAKHTPTCDLEQEHKFWVYFSPNGLCLQVGTLLVSSRASSRLDLPGRRAAWLSSVEEQ